MHKTTSRKDRTDFRMSIILTRILVTFLILVISTRAEKEKYTTQYDNINVNEVLKNDRLVKNYVGCLLDQNPCTPDAAELKRNLPDALENECSRCSEIQKEASEKFCNFLLENRKDDWDKLEAKYDPNGTYRANFLAKQRETVKSD